MITTAQRKLINRGGYRNVNLPRMFNDLLEGAEYCTLHQEGESIVIEPIPDKAAKEKKDKARSDEE